ncbi:MAG: hypothetical protein LBT62_04890 [Deltaproteobacteria bacterium]|jgi:lipopolysaccharide export system protein LptA|nr:hypothetical protein [Deltaproteobacteria bacterium]
MTKTLCRILTFTFVLSLAIWAQAADPPLGNSDGPITITADHMSSDDNSQLVTFTGRVIARQDDLIITCDTMKVYYQKNAAEVSSQQSENDADSPPASEATSQAAASTTDQGPLDENQQIYRVDCEGSVKIQQGDKLAVGDKAMYLAKSEPRRLILTGQARIWEGKNSVTGHQVVYYLDQNRSQVDSRENQRVRAFYDDGDAKKNN